MADPMRDSGLDLIREYIPDSPVYTPEDEPSQYNILLYFDSREQNLA